MITQRHSYCVVVPWSLVLSSMARTVPSDPNPIPVSSAAVVMISDLSPLKQAMQ